MHALSSVRAHSDKLRANLQRFAMVLAPLVEY